MTTSPDRAVERHYDAFPYPRVQRIAPSASPAYSAGILSYLLRRRPADAFTTTPRVWVAGCGTQQGATWGLTFPDADVLATDVSERTLSTARELATSVGARNVRFERRDLRDPHEEAPFDLIVCTGVVHHLEEPAAGLRRLRESLAPNGAALIMVYSRAHRAPLDSIRRAVLALTAGDDAPYPAACRILAEALNSRCQPFGRQLLETLYGVKDSDPSFLADVLLNPRETSYEVRELFDLFDATGLRFGEWLHPRAWHLDAHLDDPDVLARAARLDPLARAEVVQRLAGFASPLLEVLVERDDSPAREAYSRAERLQIPWLLGEGTRDLDLTAGRLGTEERIPPFVVTDGLVTGNARGSQGAPRAWAVSEALLPLLQACDGTRSVLDLGGPGADDAALDGLLGVLEALGPADVGLLAPGWARSDAQIDGPGKTPGGGA